MFGVEEYISKAIEAAAKAAKDMGTPEVLGPEGEINEEILELAGYVAEVMDN